MIWQARPALLEDHAALIDLWHQGWHDAHAGHVDPAITARRTPDFFATHLPDLGEALRVAGPPGAPLGLCAIDGTEIDLLFITRAARGTGLASLLLTDAEHRLRAAGVAYATLDCVIGNTRAARFYTREGWTPLHAAETPATGITPPLMIPVTVFGKRQAAI
ncbi:MAG: GNAT family N-acetyltransferase [Paracoccaceae bacterium]